VGSPTPGQSPATLNRRDVVVAGASTFLLAPIRATARTAEEARLSALFEAFVGEDLRQRPETATQLGFDIGAQAGLRGRLTDNSAEGIAAAKALNAAQLARLTSVDRAALSASAKVDYDTVLYTLRSQAAVGAFDFGGYGYGPSPYVVSPLTGAYQFTPQFLQTKHPIGTTADAEAYLARLEAFAGQLDHDTERMAHDAGLGISPPDFLLDTALIQMTAARTAPADNPIVTSLAQRTAAKGLTSVFVERAARIYGDKVGPAQDRQIARTRTLRNVARHDAGLGQFKDGPAFYAAALKATTTTSLAPDEVHRIGLAQAAEIGSRLDGLLRARGMVQGTVGERIAALYKDPSAIFADTGQGKAAAIAYCNDRLAAIRPRLPSRFKRLPPYAFEVRRVPAEYEAGAASAFSQPPSLDGSRPGLIYFNLHDTAEWPKWTLPTTVFHEGLPGHQLEGGLALANGALPLIRKLIGFSGYAEGWALYAEQLADEMAMYEDDPLGRIGYLKFQLFRAGRCVVDTGIHHLGWSREKAIDYLIALDGEARGFATREVERYCSTPGQACSYKLGHATWTKARGRAQQALGSRFDIKDFHEAGLACGRVPLEVLDGVIDAWISAARA
jgi:uncharacterized protein (DUF885 family)